MMYTLELFLSLIMILIRWFQTRIWKVRLIDPVSREIIFSILETHEITRVRGKVYCYDTSKQMRNGY